METKDVQINSRYLENALRHVGLSMNTLSDEIIHTKAVAIHPQDVPETLPFSVHANASQIENSTELMKEVSADISWSYSGGLSKTDGRIGIFKSVELHTYNVYMLVKITIKSQFIGDSNAKLLDTCYFTSEESAQKFHRTYGDAYVGAITVGGYYFALLEIQTKTRKQYEEVSASIGAEFSGTTKIDAKFSQKFHNATRNSSINIHLEQDGGTKVHNVETADDISKIIDQIDILRQDIAKNPVVLNYSPVSYNAAVPIESANTPPFIDTPRYKLFLQRLREIYYSVSDRADAIEYVLDNPSLFIACDTTTLQEQQQFAEILHKEVASVHDAIINLDFSAETAASVTKQSEQKAAIFLANPLPTKHPLWNHFYIPEHIAYSSQICEIDSGRGFWRQWNEQLFVTDIQFDLSQSNEGIFKVVYLYRVEMRGLRWKDYGDKKWSKRSVKHNRDVPGNLLATFTVDNNTISGITTQQNYSGRGGSAKANAIDKYLSTLNGVILRLSEHL